MIASIPPIVLSSVSETRGAVRAMRAERRIVGFVPTMGALHAGHRALVAEARRRCDRVVVSIFVNPTQFGLGEDCDRYPSSTDADLNACRDDGVDLVFLPAVEDMYRPACVSTVRLTGLTEGLCGAHRPGHFDGVTTVVAKLFNIVPADVAFFGEKDYQQLKVIERMVRDLDIPTEIVACPTVREDDGLALSSRNTYLSASERRQAGSLSRAIRGAIAAYHSGEHDSERLIERMVSEIQSAGPVSIDYVSIVDAETLKPMTTVDRPGRICLAVRIGSCRLIDNMPVGASARCG